MRYRIKVESLHPEFDVPETLKDGVEVKGYLIVGFDEDDAPLFYSMSGVSIMDIAHWLHGSEEESASDITEAFLIAEGFKNAQKHMDECKRKKLSRAALRRMMEDE